MFAQVRLPPSEHDFEVYEHVVVNGGTTRGAARYYDLSQTRICQIVQRVAEWQANVVPRAAEQYDVEDLAALAKNVAARRLQFIYDEALQSWRESQGQSCVVYNNNKGDIDRTMKKEFGQPRYLHLAIRATMQQAKLAVLPSLMEGLAADAVEQAEQTVLSSQPPANVPPVRDCSASNDPQPESAPIKTEGPVANADEPAASDAERLAGENDGSDEFDTVQREPTTGEIGPVVELQLDPNQPGVAVQAAEPAPPQPMAAPAG